MASSFIPQPSWITLIKPAMFHQVMNNGTYILPDTKCSIIYGPEPAIFNDGQLLATTHYHIDACLWRGDTFIDGATFLMPSKLPEAGLEDYSMDLDNVTGIYHVTHRKANLRTSLALTQVSKPDFSSHVVEFSNGKMTTAPRPGCATITFGRGAPNFAPTKVERDTSIAQPEVVHHKYADKKPRLACASVMRILDINRIETSSAPAGSDSSITGFGRVVGQQGVSGQSSLSSFSKSIIHVLPQKMKVSTFVKAAPAEDANANTQAEVQKLVESALSPQTPDRSIASRRSSSASQSSESPTSTVPTSPASSTFSTLPSWKSAMANLPKVPIAPGEPTPAFQALTLEHVKQGDPGKSCGREDSETTAFRRLSWDLKISFRQLNHLDQIQDGGFPSMGEFPGPKQGLAINEDGQIFMAEDTGDNVRS